MTTRRGPVLWRGVTNRQGALLASDLSRRHGSCRFRISLLRHDLSRISARSRKFIELRGKWGYRMRVRFGVGRAARGGARGVQTPRARGRTNPPGLGALVARSCSVRPSPSISAQGAPPLSHRKEPHRKEPHFIPGYPVFITGFHRLLLPDSNRVLR